MLLLPGRVSSSTNGKLMVKAFKLPFAKGGFVFHRPGAAPKLDKDGNPIEKATLRQRLDNGFGLLPMKPVGKSAAARLRLAEISKPDKNNTAPNEPQEKRTGTGNATGSTGNNKASSSKVVLNNRNSDTATKSTSTLEITKSSQKRKKNRRPVHERTGDSQQTKKDEKPSETRIVVRPSSPTSPDRETTHGKAPSETSTGERSGFARKYLVEPSIQLGKMTNVYSSLSLGDDKEFLEKIRAREGGGPRLLRQISDSLNEFDEVLKKYADQMPAGLRKSLEKEIRGIRRNLDAMQCGTPALGRTMKGVANLLNLWPALIPSPLMANQPKTFSFATAAAFNSVFALSGDSLVPTTNGWPLPFSGGVMGDHANEATLYQGALGLLFGIQQLMIKFGKEAVVSEVETLGNNRLFNAGLSAIGALIIAVPFFHDEVVKGAGWAKTKALAGMEQAGLISPGRREAMLRPPLHFLADTVKQEFRAIGQRLKKGEEELVELRTKFIEPEKVAKELDGLIKDGESKLEKLRQDPDAPEGAAQELDRRIEDWKRKRADLPKEPADLKELAKEMSSSLNRHTTIIMTDMARLADKVTKAVGPARNENSTDSAARQQEEARGNPDLFAKLNLAVVAGAFAWLTVYLIAPDTIGTDDLAADATVLSAAMLQGAFKQTANRNNQMERFKNMASTTMAIAVVLLADKLAKQSRQFPNGLVEATETTPYFAAVAMTAIVMLLSGPMAEATEKVLNLAGTGLSATATAAGNAAGWVADRFRSNPSETVDEARSGHSEIDRSEGARSDIDLEAQVQKPEDQEETFETKFEEFKQFKQFKRISEQIDRMTPEENETFWKSVVNHVSNGFSNFANPINSSASTQAGQQESSPKITELDEEAMLAVVNPPWTTTGGVLKRTNTSVHDKFTLKSKAFDAQADASTAPHGNQAERALFGLANGSLVWGYEVQSSPNSSVRNLAFREPGDPLGYHEAQQGSQCGRHTLNMVDTGPNLATEGEFRQFLAEKYEAEPYMVPQGNGPSRRATKEELARKINEDDGTSLMTIKEFQDWRLRQNVPGVRPLIVGHGNVDNLDSMAGARWDLGLATSFGVGYQKKGQTGQHNVAIRRGADGKFRVFDSQQPDPIKLKATNAADALVEFMRKEGETVLNFGLQFEYIVGQPDRQV
jgi:hypothetical protein